MKNKNFRSKYPIMLAAMNQVSTLDFAVAASKAGIFPSISGFNYYTPKQYKKDSKINLENCTRDLKTFNDITGSNDLILSVQLSDIFRDDFKDLCSLKLFSHLEVVDETRYIFTAEIKNDVVAFENLKNHFSIFDSCDIKPILKILNADHWTNKSRKTHELFSGAVIKSSNAAGLVDSNKNRKPLIEEFKISEYEICPKCKHQLLTCKCNFIYVTDDGKYLIDKGHLRYGRLIKNKRLFSPYKRNIIDKIKEHTIDKAVLKELLDNWNCHDEEVKKTIKTQF
jgi:hypothetical protein